MYEPSRRPAFLMRPSSLAGNWQLFANISYHFCQGVPAPCIFTEALRDASGKLHAYLAETNHSKQTSTGRWMEGQLHSLANENQRICQIREQQLQAPFRILVKKALDGTRLVATIEKYRVVKLGNSSAPGREGVGTQPPGCSQ